MKCKLNSKKTTLLVGETPQNCKWNKVNTTKLNKAGSDA